MKKSKVVGMLLASALVTSAVAGTAGAAAANQTKDVKAVAANESAAKLNVSSKTLVIDGNAVTLRSVQVNKATLYSLRDLSASLGASLKRNGSSLVLENSATEHVVTLKSGDKNYQVDGNAAQFTVAPQNVAGNNFVELNSIVTALGGEVNSGEVRSIARLEGEFSTPIFNASEKVIVTKEDGEALQLIKLDAGGQYEVFSSNESTVGAAISPDHEYGAFANDNGVLNLIDLSTGLVKKVGTDNTVKTDLVWSADSKKIYFVQGDKQEKISYITLATGKVTEVLADKVENKAGVQVSADEKKIVYFVNVTGTASTDKAGTEESLEIDYSNAGTQVYSLDLSTKGAKPVQLTKDLDNKMYLSLLADGRAVYVSADPEGVIANNILKVISADGANVTNLLADVDVISSELMNGKLIVLASVADGSNKVFQVDSTGAKTELYSTTENVTELSVSPTGVVALIADGKVVLVQGSKTTELTK
ncbi:hypothetical protein GCM10008013_39030 [Paenibacillus segetis]|uniref:Copper amine oxidase-like N-terminal domain-containing protein n=2 Tax=Paenibacillus segetis TaxID=1325360 RepID=A0ABQ1YRK7_9BACL|nr:hypothetical protein GCM10008013_39030 [Paenibacillus segetis]